MRPNRATVEIRQELTRGASGLAASARRMVRWRAVVVWFTFMLAVVGTLVLADALLQWEEVGLRVLSAVALVAAGGFATYRVLRPAWSFSPTSVDVAKWVEQRQPELGERLSTVVQLAAVGQDEHRFGSFQFRDIAMQNWIREGFHPRWPSYLDTSRWWRSVAGCALVVAVLTACIAAFPEQSIVGLRRLAMPWSPSPWPRNDRLWLVDPPTVVAQGSQLQLEISDENLPMPELVDLIVRNVTGEADQPTVIAATLIGDLAVANLSVVDRPIAVRAIGGDDETMAWHTINVVKPPQLEEFKFTIQPPDYSGRAANELVGKRIRVLAGSLVQFHGRLSEPVNDLSVELHSGGDSERSRSKDEAGWTATLDQNHRDFTIGGAARTGWEAQQSLGWRIVIVTDNDLRIAMPDSWSIEVEHDSPPLVTLREPLLNVISAAAQLPIQGRATDDLGLVKIAVRAMLGKGPPHEETETMTATVGREQTGPEAAEFVIWQQDSSQESDVLARTIDHSWDLSRDLQVAENQDVTLWLEAHDTFGQVGRSQHQTFAIRDEEHLLGAVQDMQQQLLERMRGLVDSQRRNMQLARRTAEIVAQTNVIEQETVDALSSVVQIQNTIRKQLADGGSSINADVDAVKRLLVQNQLLHSKQAMEIDLLSQKLDVVARGSMPDAIAAALDADEQSSRKLAANARPDATTTSALEKSNTAQDIVLQELQSVLDRMSQTESAQQVARELTQILSHQQRLRRETDDLQLIDLSGATNSEFEKRRTGLSVDQHGLARQLDRVVVRMRDLGGATVEDSVLTDPVSRAIDTLVKHQASSLMRRGGDQITGQQFSSATSTQSEIADILQVALTELGLGGSTRNGLADRAENLRNATRTITELAEQQTALAQQLSQRSAVQRANELARQQSQIQKSTSDEANRLQQAGESRIAQDLRNTLETQETVAQAVESSQMSSAASAAQEAADELTKTAQELQQSLTRLENEQRQQQVFQLARFLGRLVRDQERVVENFSAIANPASKPPASTDRELEQDVRRIAVEQEAVRQLLRDVLPETDKLPAFDWTLKQTELDMSRAVAAAKRLRVPEAVDAATSALRKLALAAEAVAQNADDQQPSQSETDGNTTQETEGDRRIIPPVASLKLLRGLQEDLNSRTLELDTAMKSGPRRDTILRELAKQQQSLGEQLEQLLREIAAEL